jgi:hypothetical protein
LPLACNTPVQIAPETASTPWLAVATGCPQTINPSYNPNLVITWLRDDALVGYNVPIVGDEVTPVASRSYDVGGADRIALARSCSRPQNAGDLGFMVTAAGLRDGTSLIVGRDHGDDGVISSTLVGVHVTMDRDIVEVFDTFVTSPDFAIVGTAGTDAVIIQHTYPYAGTPTVVGNNAMSIAFAGNSSTFAIGTSTNACELSWIDGSGLRVLHWGTDGACVDPIVESLASRDLLLVAHDPSKDELVYAIAAWSDPTYMVGLLQTLADGAAQPRATTVTDGDWVSYRRNGMLEVVHVSTSGSVGTPIVLGPLGDETGHDVTTYGDSTYAVWMSDALYIAKVCE